MGIFYNKLMESSAIQDPDEIGIDLDAIEDNIMGDDGIEAHRDEVEAAEEGLIGDPIEEASMLIYESDYNFNQIMKAIGIAELNEAYAGREFLLENENKKGFFARVREVIGNMWASITKVFNNVFNNIKEFCDAHKRLVTKHRSEIEAGFAMRDKWTVKCQNMEMLADGKFFEMVMEDALKNESKLIGMARMQITNSKANNVTKVDTEEFSMANLIHNVTGGSLGQRFDDIKSLRDYITEKTLKNASYGLNGDTNVDANLLNIVINILNGSNDISRLKKLHSDLKSKYSAYLKQLKEIEKNADSPNNRSLANVHVINTLMVKYANGFRTELNICNAIYACTLKAYKIRRSSAYKLAHAWYVCGKKDAKANKSEVQHNSAFMNFDII